jgi:predicted ester cyclase
MHTFADVARELSHSPVYLRGLLDAVAMEFRWPPDGRFGWGELMFEPKDCIARLRMNS